jgi:putative inorganic carbon (hco3(-)) transporter
LAVVAIQHPVISAKPEPGVAPKKRRGGSRLGFCLFVGVNALLLIRPQELFPRIEALHPYELMMIGCLLVYWPRILSELRWKRLRSRPITLCVVGLSLVVTLSLLWQGDLTNFQEYSIEFVKMVLYYLILICAVDTPKRMRIFAIALAVIISLVGLLPVLDHHDIIKVDTLKEIKDWRLDAESGLDTTIDRLMGVGIFNDPNDLAQTLGVGIVLCLYGVELCRSWGKKLLWLPALAVLLYAMYLTQSRGGLLGLMAGLGVLFVARFGWKRASILGVLTLPVLGAVALARTTLSTNEASAQSRVQLWSDALTAFRQNPLFGLGPGAFMDQTGQVAHNSFLHAYADTGIVGGLLFFTAYYVAIWGVLRLRSKRVEVTDPDLAKFTPILAAALVCYSVGMLSLTRNYVIPTYTMLGLSAVYISIAQTKPQKAPLVWGMSLLGRSFAWSVGYLLAMQVFVKLFVRW